MLGFNPLASAPLGDLGDKGVALSGNNVITDASVVGEATLIQDGLFAGLSVVAQNPVVDTAAVSQNHSLSATYTGNGASVPNGTMFEDENFSAPNVITGTVRVGAGSLTQNEVLSGSDVAAANPSIPSIGLTETNVFGLSDINSGAPSIESTAISQSHNVASADINLGFPTLSSVLPQVTFTVTVVSGNPSDHPYYNVGSTNKFAINGSTATADVALELIEGHTYKFDQSDSSNNNHPLRFSTTANGTHSSGTEYTDGVSYTGYAGSSGGCTIITVPFGAPTLYYYCSNHSNMGWSATTAANTSIAISQLHNITSNNVETGNVSLPNAALTQLHDLTSNNVISGAINVPQGAFTQNHPFASSDITFGNVQIDTTTCIFSFDFASPDITFGNPSIDTSGISQIHNMGLVYTGQPADVPNLTVFEDETFSAPDVFTGSVRVASAVFNQNHALTSNNVQTQQPSISNSAININHVLLSNDVTSNAPIVDNAIYGVEFLSDSVTTQAPTVAQTAISQIHNSSGLFIHSGVSVATTAITQIHFLTSDNVISQNVDVQNTKNPWDITTDTDDDNYIQILPPSETWSSGIVAPSPIFTNSSTITPFNIHTEPTSTKTDSFQSITNDISAYKNTKGRFYFSHEIISGTGTQFFRADLQLDNMTIGNTYFSMQVTNGWQTSIEHFNNFTDVTDWVDIPQSNGSVSGRWNRRSGSTPSNNTGIATSSNAYYFYTEATSTRYGYKFWLRSPVIELNDNPVLTYLLGRRGSAIGEFKIIYGREQVLFAQQTTNSSTWTQAA